MAHLIIGHTTETTARIWVRGDKACTCGVAVRPHSSGVEIRDKTALSKETDFTGTLDFAGLTAGTGYNVEATFSSDPNHRVRGAFHTFCQQPKDKPWSFTFVLSSCNLSVVSINNLLARLLATAGAKTALTSLDLPLHRWSAPRWTWLRWLLRKPLEFGLGATAKLIRWSTGIKQPGPPYLRSPFLKLSAIFDSRILELDDVDSPPTVGERVYDAGGASGVVACSPTIEREKKDGHSDDQGKIKGCTLVLTAVDGTFKEDVRVFKQAQKASGDEKDPPSQALGSVVRIRRGRKWFRPPSFFLHAGDQIYYDFPDVDREPKRSDYRLAYREAWFYDVANRHLLSHWPQYMTLDDHEIADQFARDFNPHSSFTAGTFFDEANVAYREYVHALNPPQDTNTEPERKQSGPYWYRFDKGVTRFFVLDTRTRRSDKTTPARMIDEDQMSQLLQWMSRYKDDLKFVVTSVPFVAQINEAGSERTRKWNQDAAPQQPGFSSAGAPPVNPRNPDNDKWSATRFKEQRHRIIDYISSNRIQRLIFLTGDMHCCYHASMRIATRENTAIGLHPKYESIVVHELAGGPVNQLQLANAAEFDRVCTGKTSTGFAYESVLDRFHSEVNGVVHVKVDYVERDHVTSRKRSIVPEVEWNVVRTLTDNEAADWPVHENGPAVAVDTAATEDDASVRSPESVMNGRICFVEDRKPGGLPRWPEHTRPRVRE